MQLKKQEREPDSAHQLKLTVQRRRDREDTPVTEAAPERLPRLTYRVHEVAEMLGVSEKTVRRLIARGLLKPSKALRHHLIPRHQVEEFLRATS